MATYKPAELVYSTDYRPGFHTVGVVVDGAFVPVVDPPSGHVRDVAKVFAADLAASKPAEPTE